MWMPGWDQSIYFVGPCTSQTVKYISNKEGTFFSSEKIYRVFTLTLGEKKNISVWSILLADSLFAESYSIFPNAWIDLKTCH